MKLRGLFIAAAVLLMPTAALAAPGIVTTTVSLREGPVKAFRGSTAFPAAPVSTSTGVSEAPPGAM